MRQSHVSACYPFVLELLFIFSLVKEKFRHTGNLLLPILDTLGCFVYRSVRCSPRTNNHAAFWMWPIRKLGDGNMEANQHTEDKTTMVHQKVWWMFETSFCIVALKNGFFPVSYVYFLWFCEIFHQTSERLWVKRVHTWCVVFPVWLYSENRATNPVDCLSSCGVSKVWKINRQF